MVLFIAIVPVSLMLVAYHHLLAEEPDDALEVLGLTAAGAGTAELEQGLCKDNYFPFREEDNSFISVEYFSIRAI